MIKLHNVIFLSPNMQNLHVDTKTSSWVVSVGITPVMKEGATIPDLRLRWELSDETSGAAQRVLSQVDSWLSTSPVVCVLAEQCLYPRRQHTASGPDTKTQALEFLQTPLILTCSLSLFPQINSRDKGRGVKIAQHRADFTGATSETQDM